MATKTSIMPIKDNRPKMPETALNVRLTPIELSIKF
jgi:hypothetical protein